MISLCESIGTFYVQKAVNYSFYFFMNVLTRLVDRWHIRELFLRLLGGKPKKSSGQIHRRELPLFLTLFRLLFLFWLFSFFLLLSRGLFRNLFLVGLKEGILHFYFDLVKNDWQGHFTTLVFCDLSHWVVRVELEVVQEAVASAVHPAELLVELVVKNDVLSAIPVLLLHSLA